MTYNAYIRPKAPEASGGQVATEHVRHEARSARENEGTKHVSTRAHKTRETREHVRHEST